MFRRISISSLVMLATFYGEPKMLDRASAESLIPAVLKPIPAGETDSELLQPTPAEPAPQAEPEQVYPGPAEEDELEPIQATQPAVPTLAEPLGAEPTLADPEMPTAPLEPVPKRSERSIVKLEELCENEVPAKASKAMADYTAALRCMKRLETCREELSESCGLSLDEEAAVKLLETACRNRAKASLEALSDTVKQTGKP